MSVAEIVEGTGLTDRRSDGRQLYLAPEACTPNGTASWCAESDSRSVGIHREVLRQLLDNKGRDRYGASRSVRLGRLDK